MPQIVLSASVAKVTSSGAGGGSGVRLALQYGERDYVRFYFSGSQIPMGRYYASYRIRATAANYTKVNHRVYNETSGIYINEEGKWVHSTIRTGSGWVTRGSYFDNDYREAGALCYVQVRLSGYWTNPSSCDIDYFLNVPICRASGDWPQDISHNMLREYTPKYGTAER